jgi:hypothetical protein
VPFTTRSFKPDPRVSSARSRCHVFLAAGAWAKHAPVANGGLGMGRYSRY